MRLAKELKIFLFLLLLLSLGMHFGAWMDHPLEHFRHLSQSSLGVWHPLFLTLILYVIILFLRGIVQLFRR